MPASKSTGAESRQLRRLLAFSFANADLLLELDSQLRVVFASGAAQIMTGRTEQEMLGASIADFLDVAERSRIQRALGDLSHGARLPSVDTTLLAPGGVRTSVTMTAYQWDASEPRYYVTIRLRTAPEEAKLSVRRDKQTGLMEAQDFCEAAGRLQALDTDARLTMIDLGDFDAFSRRVDPASQQKVLLRIGALLRDAAIDKRSAARLHAGKLGFVHDSTVDVDVIRQNIGLISRKADPAGAGLAVKDWTLPLEASGLKPEQSSEVLRYAVRRFAERGLDDFQPSTMNQVMQTLVNDTVSRLTSVQQTLGAKRIEIAYQPIVALSDRRAQHWEALSRPVGDQASKMVQFTEQIGLAADLDLLVCSKVLHAIEVAARSGLRPDIAVNLSASSLRNDIFLESFRQLMSAKRNVSSQLMIEITETAKLDDDLGVADNIIQELRRLGHKVCLDDFGAGESGFRYVQSLTVDYLKIDGAYVRNIARNLRDAAIVKAVAQMCADLKVKVVAEMVENETQAKTLAECGVGLAQGFHFGRPNAAEKFAQSAPPRPPQNLRRKGVVETWR